MGNENRRWVEQHKKIVDKIEEMVSNSRIACVSVSNLAKEVDMDPRIVHLHLEIMKYDRAGAFLTENKGVFCTRTGVRQLAERLGIKIED